MSHFSKKEQAVQALLTAPSVTRAAETIGISRRTLSRWLEDDSFVRELERERKAVFEHSLRRLSGLMSTALDEIERILTDGTAKDRDKLRAASLVLSHAQASELGDLLHQLETQLAEMETPT